MEEMKAREVLGNRIKPNGALRDMLDYVCWNPGETSVVLDASFSPEELEAIAWWMRHGPTTAMRKP